MISPTTLAALAVVGLVGYLIGSISSGYLVGRIYRNVDLRSVGSGSTGATNTFRTLGTGAGLLVAVLDIVKGSLAVVFAQIVFPDVTGTRPIAEAVAAVCVVAGHCWPATLRGRGGRGVATGFGALLFVATPAWASAVAAVVGALAGYLLFSATGWLTFNWATLAFIVVAGAVVFIRHRANIDRIIRGVEPRVGGT